MRLLFVVKTMHFASGGAERVLACLCNGLADRGHDVVLASFDPPGRASFYPLDSGVKWRRLGIGDASARSTFRDTLRRVGGLRRLLSEENPDAAVSFMHSSSIPLACAALGSRLPVVFSEHIVPEFYDDRPMEYALYLLSGFRARRIVVINDSYIRFYPRRIAAKMTAIPNPIAVLSDRRADVIGNSAKPKVLLAVGRLEAQKDHESLIRAFAQIAPDHPDWILRIVGEGALRGHLEALVADHGLGAQVQMPGRTKGIADEYLAAQAFCVSSVFESFGIATAEALSLGLPVVGFADCLGTNILVRDGVNGLLAPGGDRVGNLAAALDRLLGDGKLRLRLAAQGPNIAERYRPDSFILNWETLLKKLKAFPEARRR